MAAAQILVIDDDPKLLRVLTLRLEAEGYDVTATTSGEDALQRLSHHRPQFILTDLRMPGMDGIEFVTHAQEKCPGIPIAILSAHGDIPDAVRATHAGAVDFLIKPVDRESLVDCIQRHLDPLHAGPVNGDSGANWATGIVTRSPILRNVLDDALRVARTDSSVLITGRSGTGKELLARAIHRASARASFPFLAINCTAIPAEMLESELFGHKRGAIASTRAEHPGLFRAADRGVVFLDEVGDLPMEVQAKLVRVLLDREVYPLGETEAVPVDVRVISSTHADLEARVGAGSFRDDLYYQLKVVGLRVPSLEERREDIPLLVAHQLKQLAAAGFPKRVYSPEAMELLVSASWPGNVRQLFNVVEHNVALSPGRVITGAMVRTSLGEQPGRLSQFDEARSEFARKYLRQLLELTGGNISRAARLAGRNRTDFYKLLGRYQIDPSEFKTGRSAPDPGEDPED